jgi:predicted AAA+ superfamily ATPase
MCEDLIGDAIDFWLEGIAAEGPKYVFLDEVHLLDGWYSGLKNFYDQNKDIKAYISGSASLAIQVKAEQYLRGRYLIHEIWPLDFGQYLSLKSAKRGGPSKEAEPGIKKDGPPRDALSADRQLQQIYPGFRKFMLVGGFPEADEVEDEAKWFEVLENFVAQKAIYTDIAATFNIRGVKVLDAIFHHIVQNQSRILTYESINEVAGLKHEVLLDYIEYLKGSYLIVEVRKFAATVREQLGSRKKFLCVDQGLRNALLAEYEIKEDNEGFVAENIVGMHLYLAAAKTRRSVFYYKNNGEIDFVVKGSRTILVEVKYRNRIDGNIISRVQDAMEATGSRQAFIVSKRDFRILKENGRVLTIVPAAIFCFWVREYLS